MRDYANLRVAVLHGGRSAETIGSTASAAEAVEALRELGVKAQSSDIGAPDLPAQLGEADAAFVVSHGWYGEDGKLQGMLELMGIPYTGSGVLACSLGMHKPTFKKLMQASGLATPAWAVIPAPGPGGDELGALISAFGGTAFVKPASGGGSVGSGIARTATAIAEIMASSDYFQDREYMIEQYVPGFDVSVGVLEQNGSVRPLSPLHIRSLHEFYDSQAKLDPEAHVYECPAPFPAATLERLQKIACDVFRLCGCRGVARVDFIVTDDYEEYLLELNPVPGLTHHGNLATMAMADGISYVELVRMLLDSAFDRTYLP